METTIYLSKADFYKKLLEFNFTTYSNGDYLSTQYQYPEGATGRVLRIQDTVYIETEE